ncbi:unnamed protein product [Prorocentrum cordatum]|uniref:Uncharacterized protein n=1 Tax=Prorocentrum cordatum TaxID=2364126 RepID=A0ABN9XKK8_9DINO|nr:unnamed protein product [Polarella glacialis]
MVGVPEDGGAASARAGTTGCKVPESVFGGMKGYTYAVAGDHDGVGSIQTVLNTVKRRGSNWRDRDEAYSKYELTETAEDLLEFLGPAEQDKLQRTRRSRASWTYSPPSSPRSRSRTTDSRSSGATGAASS